MVSAFLLPFTFFLFTSPFAFSFHRSVIELNRAKDVAECALVVAVLVRWCDGDHVEELAVAQLRCDDRDNFGATGRLVDIIKADREAVAIANANLLVAATLAQVAIALR